jgi:Asp-tRNA(Asn)/Glu-tRNA(Gln) amidotransferase A subunit family amidase
VASTTDADSFDLLEATVEDVHAAFEAGELTAEALVDRYLARIEAFDDDLNAILTVNDDAPRRAAKLDERLETEGFVGPLHGVPIILKDNQDTHDMPTTAGSQAFAESVPPEDAFLVERLRDAGGVILAKANLQELSFGVDTISSLGGATRNAYALDRRPSGSSGGTAAAIAANLGAVGTGSDTCSFVRSPPAFNSLVGVRPTCGLVSRTGIVPLSETQDTAGPITRTVADAARMLDVMSGYDPDDPVTARGRGAFRREATPLASTKMGSTEPESVSCARSSASKTRRARPNRRPRKSPPWSRVLLPKWKPQARRSSTPWRSSTRSSSRRPASSSTSSSATSTDTWRGWATKPPYDSLADTVESGKVAPPIASRIADGEILDVDIENLKRNSRSLRRLDRRRRLAVATERKLVEENLDALLYPPSTIPPVEIPDNQPFEELNCELAAHTGLPAIVVPAGLTDDVLPVGVELLGREFSEPRLFELACAYEQATEHRRPLEGFGDPS